MRQKWEYLILDWIYSVENLPSTPAGRNQYAYTSDLHIWRPGAEEADIRPLWSSTDSSVSGNVLDVLNELGAEGWEIATHVISDTILGPKDKWAEVGYPIRTQRILKRPAGT